MAFPSVFVEVAFANDVNEATYAQTGWTEITPWVNALSASPLRGRQYELGRSEAGTLTVRVDNTDGRFTPGSERSPYFPNIKASRRLRVRGKNMVHPNVARGGARDRTPAGFLLDSAQSVGITHGTVDNDPVAAGLDAELTKRLEVTVAAGQTGTRALAAWYGPLEYGVRLAHSAYAWKTTGSVPAGTTMYLQMVYYDVDGVVITSDVKYAFASVPTTPVRASVAHTPPGTAKYGKLTLFANFPTATAAGLTFGITGAQSELPANLAPDPSAYYDSYNWTVLGSGDISQFSPVTSNAAVQVDWDPGDIDLHTVIPHLMPAPNDENQSTELHTYTATAEVMVHGTASIIMSTDYGFSGTTVSVKDTWTTASLTFVAASAEEALQFLPTTDPVSGDWLRVRKLNVLRGTSAALHDGATGVTTWEYPKDIFEGWTEGWPYDLSRPEMQITVVDRMKRLGEITLANTLPETLAQDNMDLILALNDSPEDAQGRVSFAGTWSVESGFSSILVGTTKGDLGSATYTLGIIGPTDESALLFTPHDTDQGYFVILPVSQDYVPPTSGGSTAPSPKPPPAPKATYTKTYYATWSRSYKGDGGIRSGDPDTLYQGNGPGDSFNGAQRALVGFNYSAIRKDLAGATIKSCKVTMRNEHARWNKGLYGWIGTHTYTSKPSTWNTSTVVEQRVKSWFGEGQQKTVDLGVTIGNAFKSGSANGIALGPCATDCSDNYGYWRGATQSGKPYLTITYQK